MVEWMLPKHQTGVRFPVSAPATVIVASNICTVVKEHVVHPKALMRREFRRDILTIK